VSRIRLIPATGVAPDAAFSSSVRRRPAHGLKKFSGRLPGWRAATINTPSKLRHGAAAANESVKIMTIANEQHDDAAHASYPCPHIADEHESGLAAYGLVAVIGSG
jgi:hypothetical protein